MPCRPLDVCELDLTATQYLVLVSLEERSNLSAADVARRWLVRRQSMTTTTVLSTPERALDDAERDGLGRSLERCERASRRTWTPSPVVGLTWIEKVPGCYRGARREEQTTAS